ncbi:MAG: hypothetical protein AAF361_01275 [Bacteroidota bacterium]
MNLVIQTDGSQEQLLENTSVKQILAPYDPVPSSEPLYLDNKYYHYLIIKDNESLEAITDALMQLDCVESVYEKPDELPPI